MTQHPQLVVGRRVIKRGSRRGKATAAACGKRIGEKVAASFASERQLRVQ